MYYITIHIYVRGNWGNLIYLYLFLLVFIGITAVTPKSKIRVTLG